MRIICITACFCSTVRITQESNSSFVLGVISTILSSAKNLDIVIPKPAQIASNVLIEENEYIEFLVGRNGRSYKTVQYAEKVSKTIINPAENI